MSLAPGADDQSPACTGVEDKHGSQATVQELYISVLVYKIIKPPPPNHKHVIGRRATCEFDYF